MSNETSNSIIVKIETFDLEKFLFGEKLTDHEIFKIYAETELQDEFINDLKLS
jgi:hypothetical protein